MSATSGLRSVNLFFKRIYDDDVTSIVIDDLIDSIHYHVSFIPETKYVRHVISLWQQHTLTKCVHCNSGDKNI